MTYRKKYICFISLDPSFWSLLVFSFDINSIIRVEPQPMISNYLARNLIPSNNAAGCRLCGHTEWRLQSAMSDEVWEAEENIYKEKTRKNRPFQWIFFSWSDILISTVRAIKRCTLQDRWKPVCLKWFSGLQKQKAGLFKQRFLFQLSFYVYIILVSNT